MHAKFAPFSGVSFIENEEDSLAEALRNTLKEGVVCLQLQVGWTGILIFYSDEKFVGIVVVDREEVVDGRVGLAVRTISHIFVCFRWSACQKFAYL